MSLDPQAVKIGTILLSIQKQILDVTGLDPAYVAIVASDEYTLATIESQFVYIRVFGPEAFTDMGAGRGHRFVHRTAIIYLYTRNSSDPVSDDTIALITSTDLNTDPPTLSHLDFEDQMINCLDEFYPIAPFPNSSGIQSLTVEPIHIMPDSGGKPIRKPEENIGFLRSHFPIQISYMQVNTTPQP